MSRMKDFFMHPTLLCFKVFEHLIHKSLKALKAKSNSLFFCAANVCCTHLGIANLIADLKIREVQSMLHLFS